MTRRTGVLERPDQRRTRVEIARQLGKANVIGEHAGDDLIANLPDRGVVVAEKPGFHLFLPRGAPGLDEAYERDVAADVLAKQLVGFEQVVLIVLLEDVETSGLGQRADMHRRRVHRGCDVHEPQVERAARQLDVSDVAHLSLIHISEPTRLLSISYA